MSFLNSNATSNQIKMIEQAPESLEGLQYSDFSFQLEKLALFLAQTWKDNHPEAQAESEADFNCCVMAVATELAIAAAAVGGPIALEILTGGGSAAACTVCKQVLQPNCNSADRQTV